MQDDESWYRSLDIAKPYKERIRELEKRIDEMARLIKLALPYSTREVNKYLKEALKYNTLK